MAFNLAIGLTHNALGGIYTMPTSLSLFPRLPSHLKDYRPRSTSEAAVFIALTIAASSLELFDFPPWALITTFGIYS